MDKTLLSQLRAKYPDALHGAAFRTATFINPNMLALGHREWLEANRIMGQGWTVRHMVLKPGAMEGDNPRISQTYVAGSNKPGCGMQFIDAVLKLHEYEMAQPLLGYLSDVDDAGAVTGTIHYRILAEKEGLAFKGAGIVLPVSGVILEDGEFDVSTLQAVFDAANQKSENPYPEYSRELHLSNYGDLSACSPQLQKLLMNDMREIVSLLKAHGSKDVLQDCSRGLNPFYRPQFAVFEKGLNDKVAEMRRNIEQEKERRQGYECLGILTLKRAVNSVEFHALRLSVAYMREEIRNNPPLGDRARVQKDMARAISRCVQILNAEEIHKDKHDRLLNFDYAHAQFDVTHAMSPSSSLGDVFAWLQCLVQRPRIGFAKRGPSGPPHRPVPPPMRYRGY